MEELLIRKGQVSDCTLLARMINESSEGAIDYLFDGVGQADCAENLMSGLLAREVHYSYANACIAELGDNAVGMALSFPSAGLLIGQQMENHYTKERLQYIQYFVDNKLEDSWHLDAICVNAMYRGQGIGEQLLHEVKAQAQQYDFKSVQVYVFSTNSGAIRFYEHNGFIIKREIETKDHQFLGERSPLILMQCKC